MVTRYTIEQILSYAHNTPTSANTTSLTTAANPTSLPTGTNLSAVNPTSLTTGSNPSAANTTSLTTGSSSGRSLGVLSTPPPPPEGARVYRPQDANSVYDFRRSAPSSEKDNSHKHPKNEANGAKYDNDLTGNMDRDSNPPILARPLALRVPQRPSTVRHERHSMEGTTTDFRTSIRPDLLYGGTGYDVMYSLMLHQYMEAHYRGQATAGTYVPMHYPVLDQGTGYPVVSRSRRRGGQVRFTSVQTRHLETCFTRTKYITPTQRKDIARELNLQERQVKTWFQNRRAKWRKVQSQNGEAAPVPSSSPPTSQSDDDDDDPVDDGLTGDDHTCHLNDNTDGKISVPKDQDNTLSRSTRPATQLQ